MSAKTQVEGFKLPFLSEDVFGLLSELLSSDGIAKLYFCGDKSLISKLEKSVIYFNHRPAPRRQHYWPNLVSRFSRLLSFEFVDHPSNFSSPPGFISSKIVGPHYEMLPRTITRLHLNVSNSVVSLLDPSSSDEILPLDSMFPNLRDVKIVHSRMPGLPLPNCWDPLLDLPLTKLYLKDVPVSMTRMESVWHLLEELEFTAKFEDPTSYPFGLLRESSLPSSLALLHIYEYPAWFPMKFIPRTVTDLQLSVSRRVMDGGRSTIASEDYTRLSLLNWSHLPPQLQKLQIEADTRLWSDPLTADMARLLPRSLVKFACPLKLGAQPSEILKQLPNGLRWLNMPASSEKLDYLPPNLTCISGNTLDSVKDASVIPQHLKSIVNSYWAFLGDCLQVNFERFIALPMGLTSLKIDHFAGGDHADFSKFDFSKRRNLVHLWVVAPALIQNRSFWRSINEHCRHIEILNIDNDLRDLTLLDELTFPLKTLDIKSLRTRISFGARPWANSLKELFIGTVSYPKPILTPLHELQLPTSLTDLTLTVSAIVIPSSPIWPPYLKNLLVACVVPYEAFCHFPPNLVKLGMRVPEALHLNVGPQFLAAWASLPKFLTLLHVGTGTTTQDHCSNIEPLDIIVSVIEGRCPHLLSFLVNGENMLAQ